MDPESGAALGCARTYEKPLRSCFEAVLAFDGPSETIEVVTRDQRRRRWSRVEKQALMRRAYEPGMRVSLVAHVIEDPVAGGELDPQAPFLVRRRRRARTLELAQDIGQHGRFTNK